jgi:hypothetical protein
MQQRQLSVSIIQAINRIRCRSAIDEEGRSLPADIYIVLPHKHADEILADVQAQMPGVKTLDWSFEIDGPKVSRIRAGSKHEALLAYMRNRLPGEVDLSVAQGEIGFNRKRMMEDLRDTQHALTRALNALGVVYVPGKGRNARTFLVKHALPLGDRVEEPVCPPTALPVSLAVCGIAASQPASH